MRRRITLLVLLLLLAAVASPAAPGLAQTSEPATAQPGAGIRADFNQGGFADLAASAVGEDVGSLQAAGAVSVLYGAAGGRLFTQVGAPSRPSTSSPGRWRLGTSTTTALLTWPPAPLRRISPTFSVLVRSAFCTAPQAELPRPAGNCSPKTVLGSQASANHSTDSVPP
jgi:hypothetical protein